MAVDFRLKRIDIPNGTGKRTFNDSVSFNSKVKNAQAALNGFRLDFASNDHHINVVQIDVDRKNVSGNDVHFMVECQYADKNFDDSYRGDIQVLVIADVA